MKATCRVCKRALKNPKWVALGIGPKCAKKVGLVSRRKHTDDLTLDWIP